MRVAQTRLGTWHLPDRRGFERPRRSPNESVPDELRCDCCAYRLRGLHREAACPECGASIRRAIQVDLARRAGDLTWVEFLAAFANFHLMLFVVGPSVVFAGLGLRQGFPVRILSLPIIFVFVSVALSSISAWPFRFIRNRLTPLRCSMLIVIGIAAAASSLAVADQPLSAISFAMALTSFAMLIILALVPDHTE